MVTRSPPSSMMMFGPASITLLIPLSYSSGVAPCTAKTLRPSCTRAAATSSWVESGLLPVMYISAPPSARTSQRWAVLASRWTDRAILSPLNGFVRLKSLSSPSSKGMWCLTQSILSSPLSQSPSLRLSLILEYLLFKKPPLPCRRLQSHQVQDRQEGFRNT